MGRAVPCRQAADRPPRLTWLPHYCTTRPRIGMPTSRHSVSWIGHSPSHDERRTPKEVRRTHRPGRGPRSRTGKPILMRDGEHHARPRRAQRNGTKLEALGGVEPLRRRPALQAGSSTRNSTKATRAHERNRTSALRIRIPALYPLSYAGNVPLPGFEPGTPEGHGFTVRWTSNRPRGAWGDRPELNRRIRDHNPALYH